MKIMIDIYMTDTATVTKASGVDQWGTPLNPVSSPMTCRFEWGTRLIRNEKGEQVVSRARVLTKESIGHNDTITFGGEDYVILSIAQEKDFYGQYYVVYLQ